MISSAKSLCFITAIFQRMAPSNSMLQCLSALVILFSPLALAEVRKVLGLKLDLKWIGTIPQLIAQLPLKKFLTRLVFGIKTLESELLYKIQK